MKVRALILSSVMIIFVFAVGCATTEPKSQSAAEPIVQAQKTVRPSKAEIEASVVKELEELGEKELAQEEKEAAKTEQKGKVTYDIPITINKQVEYFIDYFQTRISKRFGIWLARSGRYVPMMRAILREYNLPEDLVYLAMIESGFSCKAYSRAHAVGPWQFIRGTARRYGLKVNYWVDERRDPVKATHAAAKYLRDLYAEFNSWYLAAAGYNAGENKIRRALARYRADDFWSISQRKRRYLKRETKQYVPKMIAAALIAKNPSKYGFDDIKYYPPLEFDQVKVYAGTSISVAAKLIGLKTGALSELNPELRRWCTPPSGGMYTLRVPEGKGLSFKIAYAALPARARQARIGAIRVRVQSGDTLGRIAKTHGMRLSDLMAVNPKLNPRRLRIGQRVYVPANRKTASLKYKPRSARTKATRPRYTVPHRNKRKIVYVVKKGDSLWEVAQTYGLNYHNIKRWNGKRSSRLQIGQKLVLYVPPSKAEAKVERQSSGPSPRTLIYLVRRGDSLWKIGQRFKVTPRALRRWNGLNSSRITPGDRLTVRLEGKIL